MDLYDRPEVKRNLFWDYLEMARAFHKVSLYIEQNGSLRMKQTHALWGILRPEFESILSSHFALAKQYSPIENLPPIEKIDE